MGPKRILPRFREEPSSLGLPTIMDRALAAAHGATYVHLAVFSIDVDRLYWVDLERADMPFGWEVFLTECYVLQHLDATDPTQRDLLEAVCLDIMDETPGEPPLGGQLVFAIHDAVERQHLPPELRALFSRWPTQPNELRAGLDELWKSPTENLVKLTTQCLQTQLSPPLAPPTVKTLQAMSAGLVALSPQARP